jgi:hypothetical protein
VVFGLELVAELVSDKSVFSARFQGVFWLNMGLALLAQVLLFAVILIPLGLALQGALWIGDELRRLWFAARRWRDERALYSAELALERLRAGRSDAAGVASLGDAAPRLAPLSGRPCLAFRLVGRAGGARIDDADATELLVRSGEEVVVARAERVVALLASPEGRERNLDAAARARVTAFLDARGIPFDGDYELGETLVVEGDRITLYGVRSSETSGLGAASAAVSKPGAGYRAVSRMALIDDSDGEPLVIVA